ncbi:hypothetical protein DsansV1_C10g0099401 [Dioscorea sansibarensis]
MFNSSTLCCNLCTTVRSCCSLWSLNFSSSIAMPPQHASTFFTITRCTSKLFKRETKFGISNCFGTTVEFGGEVHTSLGGTTCSTFLIRYSGDLQFLKKGWRRSFPAGGRFEGS